MNENPFGKLDGEGLPPGPPPKAAPSRADPKPKLERVVLQYERAGRGGKEVTILQGQWIESQEMRVRDALLRDLKRALGTGGALEGREIVLQGDRRDTAKAWLLKAGFTTNL
ncbi:MAG: translation initiation factor [Verrucomicrobiota bacterium]